MRDEAFSLWPQQRGSVAIPSPVARRARHRLAVRAVLGLGVFRSSVIPECFPIAKSPSLFFEKGHCHVEEIAFAVGFRLRLRRGLRDCPRRFVRQAQTTYYWTTAAGTMTPGNGTWDTATPELVNDHHGRRHAFALVRLERGHRRLLRQQQPNVDDHRQRQSKRRQHHL